MVAILAGMERAYEDLPAAEVLSAGTVSTCLLPKCRAGRCGLGRCVDPAGTYFSLGFSAMS